MADALDNLNNRKAIQQADKILKKQKDLHCAKVIIMRVCINLFIKLSITRRLLIYASKKFTNCPECPQNWGLLNFVITQYTHPSACQEINK